MVSKIIDVGLRGLQFLWTLLVLALIGNMISSVLPLSGNPSIINYAIFVAVFSMLSLLVLLPSAIMGLFAGTPIPLALDVLNTLFFFCGAVALSSQLGVHSCADEGYTKGNKITNGAVDRPKRCREAQASTAFMWFAFFTYAVSMAFSALTAKSSGVNLRGSGIRKVGLGHV